MSKRPRAAGIRLARAWLACALIPLAGPAAAAGAEEQFLRQAKIDAHVHLNALAPAEALLAQAARDNVRVLEINVDYPDYPPIEEQQRLAQDLRARHPGRVEFAATFPVDGFGAAGWAERTVARIDAARGRGAVGVKVWKNIGMVLRDADGRYVQLDDARLRPVFDWLERNDVVLLGHQAEPRNCWLPLEQMTVRGDREYFTEHPQYYMAKHPEMPTHEAILAARDRMLATHPALRFDGVHLASLEWDVDLVARFLDRFPHARVDLAARLVHLEVQAAADRAKVRAFLIRYQDRVLYGTDLTVGAADAPEAAARDAHDTWLADWRFLASGERLSSPDFAASFEGLALPPAVLEKIYRANALRLFRGAWAGNS